MYYVIDTSFKTKVIGSDYPQMQEADPDVEDGLDLLSRRKGQRVLRSRPIHNLKMGYKGKLTDVISCSLGAGFDFMISKRLHEIVSGLQCNSVQFFPMKFDFQGRIINDYKWVHFTYAFEKHIDFSNSVYDEAIMKGINKNKPGSYEDYLKLVDTDAGKYGWLRLKKTLLKPSFPENEDLFMLCHANQKRYISERLFEIMMKEKITGLDIENKNDLIVSRTSG